MKTHIDLYGEKEVPRMPEVPDLSPRDITKITETVFVGSNPQRADVIFVFGSAFGEDWKNVADLYFKGFAPFIYVAGGFSQKLGDFLSHTIRDTLVKLGVPALKIVVDEQSTSTLEDVKNAKVIFEREHLPYSRILFVAKAPHSGRCLRTLMKVFPDSELFPFTYDVSRQGALFTKDNWWADPVAKSLVYGEYLRTKLYAERGDIASL